MTHTILIVDNDPVQCQQTCQVIAQKMGYRTLTAASGREVVDRFLLRTKPSPDLILMNLMLADLGGMDVIRAVRRSDAQLPIIVLASQREMRHAAEAIRAGANDFLLKPVDLERLRLSMHNLLQRVVLSSEVDRLSRHHEGRVQFSDMVGHSAAFTEVVSKARRAADSIVPILIEGEGGSGKELLAQAIHGSGKRSGRPFVSINASAMAPDALEVALLGRAASGRLAASMGKIAEADGGTLFIKHVDALSAGLQRRLLAVLQSDKVQPLGADMAQPVNIRVILSASQPLADMVRRGEFCPELYRYISQFPLQLSSLRTRREDVVPLAEHFIRRYGVREGKPCSHLHSDAAQMLLHYHWPGNVRELRHVMVRAVMQSTEAVISPKLLISVLLGQVSAAQSSPLPDMSSLYAYCEVEDDSSLNLLAQDGNMRRIHELEAEMIQYAIRLYKGRMSEVARRLGIGRSTLYRKIQDYKLTQIAG